MKERWSATTENGDGFQITRIRNNLCIRLLRVCVLNNRICIIGSSRIHTSSAIEQASLLS